MYLSSLGHSKPRIKQAERITDPVRHHLPNPLTAALDKDILGHQLRRRRSAAPAPACPLPFVILRVWVREDDGLAVELLDECGQPQAGR